MTPRFRRAEISRALEVARASFASDRVRTRAALVAVALAMAVLICLTALVERGRAATIRSLERAGLANLYLLRHVKPAGVGALTTADAERFAELYSARSLAVLRLARRTLSVRGRPLEVPVYGVAGLAAGVFGLRSSEGRLLADADGESKSPFCVVGASLAKEIAPVSSPLDQILSIGRRSYQVVGALAPSPSESAPMGELPSLEWDRAVVVPLGTEPEAREEPDARYPIDAAVASFGGAGEAERVAENARRSLPALYGTGGPIAIASPQQTLRQYRQTRSTFDRLILLVAVLTAVSAILGISNLLSAAVIARSKEIGLRRAVGATPGDIVLQFELEGLLIGLLGGAAGLAVGSLIAVAFADGAPGAPVSLVSASALAASSALIGVAAGLLPARRAARIDPAVALREG